MAICGHINRHSYGADGKLDNLKCTLEKGHDGLHQAEHYEVATQLSASYEGGEFRSTIVDGKEVYEATVVRQWSDAAGIPAKEISPGNPGVQIIQAYDMFPEKRDEEMNKMREELEALKAEVTQRKKPKAKKVADKE